MTMITLGTSMHCSNNSDNDNNSVVTVLDFPFSIGFGSVLEEKPRFRFRFRFSSHCRVDQSTREEMRCSGRDVLCTRSTHLKPHRTDLTKLTAVKPKCKQPTQPTPFPTPWVTGAPPPPDIAVSAVHLYGGEVGC